MPTSGTFPDAVQPKTDLDKIQGAWTSIAGPRDCRLLISGNHYAFEIIDGDIYIGTFDIQPEASPRRMNMTVAAGPEGHRNQSARCIYHIEGDVLRWCASKPGSKCDLNSFPSIDNDCFLSLVFRRVRSRAVGKS